jgi:alpha-tubulin suppressor-like RCC1 family protein
MKQRFGGSRFQVAAMLGWLGMAACGGDGGATQPTPTPDTYSGQVAASQTADIFVSDSAVVTMSVTNQNGQAAAGQGVFFAVTSGQATLAGGPPWTTDASGRATTVVRATNPGSVTVAGYLGTSTSGTAQGQVGLAFIADELSAELSLSETGDLRMSVEPRVTVHVTNQNDDPVAGQAVTFGISAGSEVAGFASEPILTTDANGEASVGIVGLNPGTALVRAFFGSDTLGMAVAEETVTFVVGPPTALRFVAQPRLTLPGMTLAIAPEVAVVDDEDWVVEDAGVEIRLSTVEGADLQGTTLVTSGQTTAVFTDVAVPEIRAGIVLAATADGLETGYSEPLSSMYRDAYGFSGYTACMPSSQRQVYCWGSNTRGTAGLHDEDRLREPVLATGSGRAFESVVSTNYHTCGISSIQYEIWCWGTPELLGSPHAGAVAQGEMVKLDGTGRFSQVSVSNLASCGILREGWFSGLLLCWGYNNRGQLGTGDNINVLNTVTLGGLAQGTTGFRQVSMGVNSACAIDQDGSLFCWGSRADGLVGDGRFSEDDPATLPVEIGSDRAWRSVSLAAAYACAVSVANELYCWGNDSSLDNIMATGGASAVPTRADLEGAVVAVELGQETACAAMADGRLMCWGADLIGATDLVHQVTAAPETFSNFSVGLYFACLTDADGQPFCWGNNTFGSLGRGAPNNPGGGITMEPYGPVSGGLTMLTAPLATLR